MSELFPASEVESPLPRLRWMRRHNLIVFPYSGENNDFEEEFACMPQNSHRFVLGKTPDDAIANWATKMRIPLWNEESL